MLATDKISNAFKAIVEEAEKIAQASPSDDVAKAVNTIISIAKHQSDIRGLEGGKCSSGSKCGCHS
ncbi:MAG: hypothetical protein COA36_05890 [Desulfotalea sp.]|nr:MAG: hypothetical protein COA36_05890 [Desulfotalea sp.]